jgi:hypothetical protein
MTAKLGASHFGGSMGLRAMRRYRLGLSDGQANGHPAILSAADIEAYHTYSI